jgi:hypothetical protein
MTTACQYILTTLLLILLSAWLLTFTASAQAQQTELRLEPCEIELVDGRVVEGHLAVQFDLDDRLIVYAPRLATMRSFMKQHVHALTVNGQREQINPKRELTQEDQTLLGRVQWPNTEPETGLKPAYTTEQWDKPDDLMVWASPGKSGRLEEPMNWLRNGEPMTEWPRAVGEHFGLIFFKGRTDILFPASSKRYVVRPRAGNARPRHITAETGVDAEVSLNNCTGNLWISPHAQFNGGGGAQLGGDKHTFFINGTPYTGDPPTTPERFRELMESAAGFGRKWVVRKADPQASMTLVGSFASGDETHWLRGITILAENSVIAVGPRCVQTIESGGTMIMKSGAVLGKRSGNQAYKNDMRVKGQLLIGTPDEPITRDVFLGISIKDSKQTIATEQAKRFIDDAYVRGLTVAPGGQIKVHSARPGEARLHITWHGVVGTGVRDDGTPENFFNKLPESERTINVNFLGDQMISDVVFDWVGAGDVRLLNPDIREQWERIGFGENNTADSEAVFTKLQPGEETRKQIAQWRKQASDAGERGTHMAVAPGHGVRYLRIVPSGGTFAAGDTVQVRLDALGDPEVRYTLDGTKAKDGKIYDGPFELMETTTVKAGCHEYPPPRFYRRWTTVSDTFNFVDEVLSPAESNNTTPGLRVRLYEENKFETLRDPSAQPVTTQTLNRFELKVPDGRMKQGDGYLYTGYIEVDEPGIYRFYTESEGPSRLYIGDQLIVENHRRYRYDWKPAGKAPLESWGSIKLESGKHAIRVEYLRGRGFSWWNPREDEPFEVSYEGPGIEKQPIPADALSH